jgi:hypothetical protein
MFDNPDASKLKSENSFFSARKVFRLFLIASKSNDVDFIVVAMLS